MKEIKLLNLTISNWRGQNHNIDFKYKTSISAKNGVGKSTLLHAWLWVLTGYTEVGNPKNTNLFDNREVLSEHTPWASVAATMEIDGYKYMVERKSKPKFTRSKGSLEFTKGNADLYEYYIDNIEVGASGMTNFVEGTIGVPNDMLIYCLSGEFFSYLASEDKNRARAILSSIAGEVKAEDFKGDYSSIKELMERYGTGEIVEMSKKKKKPLEDRQNIIPLEIDRKETRLSELRAMDFTATENEIVRVKEEIDAIDGLLLGNADALKPILNHNAEIENKLANKRLSLVNGRLDYKEEQNARTSEIKAKIAEIKRYNESIDKENAKIASGFKDTMRNNDILAKEMQSLEVYLNTLRERKDEVKSRAFTDDHCPYCGAELDPMEIENKKKAFNEAKKAELDAIVAEGKATKEKLERKQKEYAEGTGVVEDGMTLLEKMDISPYEEALARVEASFVPYEETDEFKRINAEIDALMSEIKEVPSNDNEALTSRKKTLIDELSELSKKLGLKDEIGRVEKDIEELRSELRSVANAIAELEKLIYTSKQWEDERNNIVSYKINHELESSKIEMFSTLKNGETVSDCVVLNKRGVRMASTNFSDRILIAIDMQMLFMKKMGVRLPIWVDESAVFSSNNLPHREGYQMIFMFPSDSPYLVIE